MINIRPHEEGSAPFHAHSNWFFWRNPDGSVVIEHHVYGDEKNELDELMYTIDAKDSFDADQWASIVAHVSVFGDTRDKWIAARNLHNGTEDKP